MNEELKELKVRCLPFSELPAGLAQGVLAKLAGSELVYELSGGSTEGRLYFSEREWDAFLDGAEKGEFDLGEEEEGMP